MNYQKDKDPLWVNFEEWRLEKEWRLKREHDLRKYWAEQQILNNESTLSIDSIIINKMKNNKQTKVEVAQTVEQPKEVVEVKEVVKTKKKRYHKPKAKVVTVEEKPVVEIIIEQEVCDCNGGEIEQQYEMKSEAIEEFIKPRKVPFLIRIKNWFLNK